MTRLVDVHLVAFELRKFLDLTWAIDSASEVPEGASAGRDAFPIREAIGRFRDGFTFPASHATPSMRWFFSKPAARLAR
ncbi:MAG: hypothetical protein WCF38_25050 [Pseudolabrys sp.]